MEFTCGVILIVVAIVAVLQARANGHSCCDAK